MSDNTILIWISSAQTFFSGLCAFFAWKQHTRQKTTGAAMNSPVKSGWFIAAAILGTGALYGFGYVLYMWLRASHPYILFTSIAGMCLLVAAIWATVLKLPASANQEIKREFEKLADEDSAEMNKRLILCGVSARLYLETVEPYIDVVFKIVNASMFYLMSDRVEGNAFYRGYSGEKCYLSRTPIIADPFNVFTLPRATLGELTLKQFVPVEITDNIAANKGRLKLDFGEVRVYFRFPGTGGHGRFCWFGDEVEVAGPSVSNETPSNPGGLTIHADAGAELRLNTALVGKSAMLQSRAGEARGLLEKLEEVWHLYINERNPTEPTLLYPLSAEAIPEEIKEFRHKQLFAFRVVYNWHVASIRRVFPDFHSDIIDGQFPSKIAYLAFKRNLEKHAELLDARGNKCLSSGEANEPSLAARTRDVATRFKNESQDFLAQNPRPDAPSRLRLQGDPQKIAGDFLNWKHKFAGWFRSRFSSELQQVRDEMAAQGLNDQELDTALSDMSAMSQSQEKVSTVVTRLRFLASHLEE
jgi:hypothetical protein